MSEWNFTITKRNKAELAREVLDVLKVAPPGHVLTIAEPDQSRKAQCKHHAMIADIAAHCTFAGRRWRPESWKRLLVESFINVERADAASRNDDDPFPGQVMLAEGLDGESIVQLGEQTRAFSRRQASAFVEALYAYGSERDVVWSEVSRRAIRDMFNERET